MDAITGGGNGGLWGLPLPFHHSSSSNQRRRRRRTYNQGNGSSSDSTGKTTAGYRFPLKQAATAASLAFAGDTFAQLRHRYSNIKALSQGQDQSSSSKDVIGDLLSDHDWIRALRMTSYGFLLYGPGSYAWYQYLERSMPKQNVRNVLLKVLLNQIVLGPTVIAVVFAWNNLWLGKLSELPSKYQKDALPTLLFGFRFWVPVSLLNFWVVPLQARVAFMCTGSIFWNFCLSSTMSKYVTEVKTGVRKQGMNILFKELERLFLVQYVETAFWYKASNFSGIKSNYMRRRSLPPPPNLPPWDLWRAEEGYGYQRALNNYSYMVRHVIRGNPFGDSPNNSGGLLEPWVPTEGRIMAGPLSGFPSFLLPILDDMMARETTASPIHTITPAPHLQLMREQEVDESTLTLTEQNKVLKKLRREIYNPAPKRLTKRVSLFYRDNMNSKRHVNHKEKQEDDEDDKKRSCAICLDDFEAKQVVMITPCNHMFHEECIVPWVKDHSKCPVCRFAL